jgi:hypothetical protein
MRNATIDWKRIHIVGSGNVESTICVGVNYFFRIAECATDMNVSGCVSGDEPGIVAAPRADDLAWHSQCVVTRGNKHHRQNQGHACHTST